MSNRTVRYTTCEIGRVRVIEDFLPAHADLVPREDNVKVTQSLSRRSLGLVDTHAGRQAGGKKL